MKDLLKEILLRTQKEKRKTRESFHHLREHIKIHGQHVKINVDSKGQSGEVSDGNKFWKLKEK